MGPTSPMHAPKSPPLDARLASLKTSVANELPPPSVDRALAAAIEHRQRKATDRTSRSPLQRWVAWPVAVAISISVLAVVVRSLLPGNESTELIGNVTPSSNGAFLPMVPLADIQRAGDATVISARLPRMTLAELGLPVNPARAADTIDAELLVGGDGAVLAVRFVY